MAATSAPYGLRPTNLLGSQPSAGGTRLYKIPSGLTNNLFYGDPVIITSSGSARGTIARFNTTETATTTTASGTFVGVFLGFTYTDATYGKTFRQFFPSGLVASDAYAYVCDDPDALFQVQADGAIAQTRLGCNVGLIQTVVGNTTTGQSGVAIQASTCATTATLPLRIVDFVDAPGSSIGDAYTDVIVRINTHFHRTTTGTAAS